MQWELTQHDYIRVAVGSQQGHSRDADVLRLLQRCLQKRDGDSEHDDDGPP